MPETPEEQQLLRRREQRLRRRATEQDLALRKSRVRTPHLDDLGGFQIIDPSLNAVIRGSRFELDLDDIEEYLS